MGLHKKMHMNFFFRLAYFHLALIHYKGQGQGQGQDHAHFDCEYLANGDRIVQILQLPRNRKSLTTF